MTGNQKRRYVGVEGTTCACGLGVEFHLHLAGELYCPQPEGYYDTEEKLYRGALEAQEGGAHYKGLKIQPVEYIHANNIPFCEGSAIKYLTRWRSKGGVEDLKKAKHFIELLIELEEKHNAV